MIITTQSITDPGEHSHNQRDRRAKGGIHCFTAATEEPSSRQHQAAVNTVNTEANYARSQICSPTKKNINFSTTMLDSLLQTSTNQMGDGEESLAFSPRGPPNQFSTANSDLHSKEEEEKRRQQGNMKLEARRSAVGKKKSMETFTCRRRESGMARAEGRAEGGEDL